MNLLNYYGIKIYFNTNDEHSIGNSEFDSGNSYEAYLKFLFLNGAFLWI